MTPTPTDPGAIDLEAYKIFRETLPPERVDDLIAAVEALREQVKGYDTLFDLSAERERPWLEKWRIANGRPDALPDYGKMLEWLYGQIEAAEARVLDMQHDEMKQSIRLDAAEARVAVLAGALDEIVAESEDSIECDPASNAELSMYNIARAALATTRAAHPPSD